MQPHVKAYLKQAPLLKCLVPYWKKVREHIGFKNPTPSAWLQRDQYVGSAYQIISKADFIHELRTAIERQTGYATGKIGATAQYMVSYEMFLDTESDKNKIREFESGLERACLKQQGIYPVDNEFYRQYGKFYIDHARNLDTLGICYYSGEVKILKYYRLNNKLIYYVNQEPERSEENCYLPYFRDKRLLIVCPFGDVLKSQATKEIFEGVWSKTGKKWFYPKSVDALEFPYGFAPDTHRIYPTVLELFDDIKNRLHRKDFDVALIAAAGLAIPIASYIKSMGKIAIDLGGHLQFVFGVLGKRWRDSEDGKRNYYNDFWIDMPARYKPKETDVCDNGAYW